jgi:heat shock protein HslJ
MACARMILAGMVAALALAGCGRQVSPEAELMPAHAEAIPAEAGKKPAYRLLGIWRILSINERTFDSVEADPHFSLFRQIRFEGAMLQGGLDCGYVNGAYDPAKNAIKPESITADTTKCSATEIESITALAGILKDPAAQYNFVDGILTVGNTAQKHARLSLVPGTQGPLDPNLDILGGWYVTSIDGVPPLAGHDQNRKPGIRLSAFTLNVYSGCNSAGGDITWDARTFSSAGAFVSTAMGCGDLSGQEEVLQSLAQRPSLVLRGDQLVMTSQDGSVVVLHRE